MSDDAKRCMRCPFCGHVAMSGGIGAVYCGPHKLDNGEYWPAMRMQEMKLAPTPLAASHR